MLDSFFVVLWSWLLSQTPCAWSQPQNGFTSCSLNCQVESSQRRALIVFSWNARRTQREALQMTFLFGALPPLKPTLESRNWEGLHTSSAWWLSVLKLCSNYTPWSLENAGIFDDYQPISPVGLHSKVFTVPITCVVQGTDGLNLFIIAWVHT